MNQAKSFSDQISTLKLHSFDFFPDLPVFTLVLLTLESLPTLFSTDFLSVFGFLTDFTVVFDFFFESASFSSLPKLTSAPLFLVLMPPLLFFASLFSDFLDDFDDFDDFPLSLFTFSVDVSFFDDFDLFPFESTAFFESLLLLADLDLLEVSDLSFDFDLDLEELLAAFFPASFDFLGRSVFPFLTWLGISPF